MDTFWAFDRTNRGAAIAWNILNGAGIPGILDVMKPRLADFGGTPLVGSPADLGKLIADETEKWGKVVKFTGIKADSPGGLGATFHNSRCTKPLRGRDPVAKVCSPIVQLRMLDLRI
jgi:hypothetical protein